MLTAIDAILNRYTMYRVVLYGLILLLAVAFIFALTGNISIGAGGLIINLALLTTVSYAANRWLAKLLKVATNTESWLITALILSCILPTTNSFPRALTVCLTAVLAMVSKYLLTWRRSPLFNPAAIAALFMSLTGLLPATWWIGSPPMAAFVAIVGFLILRKQRKFSLFAAFAAASFIIFLVVNHVSGDQSATMILKNLILSWPLLFMGSVMLTEPSTLPPNRYYQVLYGALVGAIFTSQLHAGWIASTPQLALVAGNLFALIVTPRFAAALSLKRQTRLAEGVYDLAFELPAGQALKFLPGQYMEWTLPHAKTDARGNRRTFSIASSPGEDELHIGIRHYQPSSSFKSALLALQPGQTIKAARPAGDFLLPADPSRPLIFIAGGIGITPFRSMIKYLIDSRQNRRVLLFYVARNKNDFVYREIFDKAEAVGLKTYYVTGKIRPSVLEAATKKLDSPLIYISGSNAMVSHYQKLVLGIGVLRPYIKVDYFSGY